MFYELPPYVQRGDIFNFHSLMRAMTSPPPGLRMNSIAAGIRKAMRIDLLSVHSPFCAKKFPSHAVSFM